MSNYLGFSFLWKSLFSPLCFHIYEREILIVSQFGKSLDQPANKPKSCSLWEKCEFYCSVQQAGLQSPYCNWVRDLVFHPLHTKCLLGNCSYAFTGESRQESVGQIMMPHTPVKGACWFWEENSAKEEMCLNLQLSCKILWNFKLVRKLLEPVKWIPGTWARLLVLGKLTCFHLWKTSRSVSSSANRTYVNGYTLKLPFAHRNSFGVSVSVWMAERIMENGPQILCIFIVTT